MNLSSSASEVDRDVHYGGKAEVGRGNDFQRWSLLWSPDYFFSPCSKCESLLPFSTQNFVLFFYFELLFQALFT